MKKQYTSPILEEILMDTVNDILTVSVQLEGDADIEFDFG